MIFPAWSRAGSGGKMPRSGATLANRLFSIAHTPCPAVSFLGFTLPEGFTRRDACQGEDYTGIGHHRVRPAFFGGLPQHREVFLCHLHVYLNGSFHASGIKESVLHRNVTDGTVSTHLL